MIFCFVRETKQLTLEELDRKQFTTDSYSSLTDNSLQRSFPSRQASLSLTRLRSGCLTLSSAISSARRLRSPHQSLSELVKPLTLPKYVGTDEDMGLLWYLVEWGLARLDEFMMVTYLFNWVNMKNDIYLRSIMFSSISFTKTVTYEECFPPREVFNPNVLCTWISHVPNSYCLSR
jgi:hypothetical protein